MKVSLKQTKNNKQGNLSKASMPVLRDDYSTKCTKGENCMVKDKACVIKSLKYREKNTNQKSDLNISSKGVGVLGKKSSWTRINS